MVSSVQSLLLHERFHTIVELLDLANHFDVVLWQVPLGQLFRVEVGSAH